VEKIHLGQLGERLKYYRKAKGYSNYEKLANELNISRTQYGKYEAGGNIKFSTLITILNFLEIPAKEFFDKGFN
jgi:transcriptional regulator with XRE-family HTH domain